MGQCQVKTGGSVSDTAPVVHTMKNISKNMQVDPFIDKLNDEKNVLLLTCLGESVK